MYIRSYFNALIVGCLVGATHYCPVQAIDHVHNPHTRVESSGSWKPFAFVAVAAGVIGFFTWLFSGKSDERILADAQETYRDGVARYQGMVNYVLGAQFDRGGEGVLGNLVITHGVTPSYLQEFNAFNRHLNQVYAALDTRKRKIANKTNKDYQYQAMCNCARVIDPFLQSIVRVNKYLNDHSAYFDLCEALHDLQNRYGEEKALFTTRNGQELKDALNSRIILEGHTHHDTYYHVRYINNVSSAITSLQGKMSVANVYSTLHYAANEWVTALTGVHAAVVNDQRYIDIKLAYEREQQERVRHAEQMRQQQEHTRVLEEQAAAQAASAAAQFAQAEEMRRANELKAVELGVAGYCAAHHCHYHGHCHRCA